MFEILILAAIVAIVVSFTDRKKEVGSKVALKERAKNPLSVVIEGACGMIGLIIFIAFGICGLFADIVNQIVGKKEDV